MLHQVQVPAGLLGPADHPQPGFRPALVGDLYEAGAVREGGHRDLELPLLERLVAYSVGGRLGHQQDRVGWRRIIRSVSPVGQTVTDPAPRETDGRRFPANASDTAR